MTIKPLGTIDFREWVAPILIVGGQREGAHKDTLQEIILEFLPKFHEAFEQKRPYERSALREGASWAGSLLFNRESSRKEGIDNGEAAIWKVALEAKIALYEEFHSEGKPGLKKADIVWGSLIQNAVASYTQRSGLKMMVGAPSDEKLHDQFASLDERINFWKAAAERVTSTQTASSQVSNAQVAGKLTAAPAFGLAAE